ncbi:thioredoxin family protein [Candidatus Woesebacteria bacterium]|nr:thioredoxin family protein [Candidatus Woesebacteria bacterium]
MNIQVLGSGCATCKKLYEIVTKAVKELQLENEVEYIAGAEGIEKMIVLGALGSPAIAIDGAIVMTGFTNDKNKIKSLIQSKIK